MILLYQGTKGNCETQPQSASFLDVHRSCSGSSLLQWELVTR